MKYLRYFALVSMLMLLPLAYTQAEVHFGVGVVVGPSYVAGPPVCPYGYYSDYPYGCAPYGYYSPAWFVNGVFIGAGPWYHARVWAPGYYGRRFYDRDDYRGYYRRDYDRDYDRRYFRHDEERDEYGRHGYEGRGEGYRGDGDHDRGRGRGRW